MLSPDAAMVVGLASTAIPFADSPEGEAERWLRVLRLHGEAGRALTVLGVGEAPLAGAELAAPQSTDASDLDGVDVITSVEDHALHRASDRGTSTVGTADVLLAVMDVYGEHFDYVLEAHGATRDDVIESLATGNPKA
jgi:hypothetical protein